MFDDELKRMITEWSEKIFDDVVKTRRLIHQYPEVGFELERTAQLIEKKLAEYGIKRIRRAAETGIIAEVGEGECCVALRADMDALELTERTGLPYASAREGYMHACGHDVHTAILTGAAAILSSLAEEGQFSGRVRLIFQPNEENAPGGAGIMIEEGALEGVSSVIALHNYTWYRTGQIALREGICMANADDFDIHLRGRSVHASRPQDGRDAIVAGAELVSALQSVVSRRFSPFDPVVITVGRMRGGTRRNIIADHVELNGTARTLSDENRKRIEEEIHRVARGIAEAYNVDLEFIWKVGYPVLVNDPLLTRRVAGAGKELLGHENVVFYDEPTLGGEDFSLYTHHVPGCMIRLGAWDGRPETQFQHHSPHYVIDEESFKTGMKIMVGSALAALRGDQG